MIGYYQNLQRLRGGFGPAGGSEMPRPRKKVPQDFTKRALAE